MIKNKRSLMFGLSIKLEHNLGTIYQLTLKDVVEYEIDIESFYVPFIVDKNIMIDDKNRFDMLMQLHILKQDNGFMNSLINSLKMLYRTDDITLDLNNEVISVDKKYTLNSSNYDYLCTNIADIFMLDTNDIQKRYDDLRKEKERPKTERDRKIAAAKAKSRRNRPKEDVFDLVDMSNYLIHSTEKYTYENVLNMTVWQIKNSFNIYNKKEKHDMDKRYRTSGNFDLSKEKFEHWFFKN